jgi:hypothetical protein
MSFIASPNVYFTGWLSNGTDITLPIASVDGLTVPNADPVTGDIRQVMFSMCEQVYGIWYALATADKSTKMTISRSQSINQTTSYITRSYTYTFVLDPVITSIVAE